MANHCVEDTCLVCGTDFCLRGCGSTCKCGNEASEYTIEKYLFWTPEKLKEERKKQNE
jgi:hypothetical protein